MEKYIGQEMGAPLVGGGNWIYRSEEAHRVSEKRHLEFYQVEDVRVQEKHGISRGKESKAKIKPKDFIKFWDEREKVFKWPKTLLKSRV